MKKYEEQIQKLAIDILNIGREIAYARGSKDVQKYLNRQVNRATSLIIDFCKTGPIIRISGAAARQKERE